MTKIYFAESHVEHERNFEIDVPEGSHWLLVLIKTPAEFWVNGEIKEYPAHSVILYRPTQKVYYRACNEFFINDWIRFETTEPYIVEAPLPHGIPLPLSDPEYCYRLMELISIEHHYNRPYKRSSIDGLLRTLMNKLLESNCQYQITPQYYDLLRLRNAIYAQPSESWSISKMASFLMISSGYLQMIYKKTFGITCMEDVIYCRMRLAKEYLQYSSLSVSEIAVKCGYQNVEHFHRQFKKLTGITPRQFQSNIMQSKKNVII